MNIPSSGKVQLERGGETLSVSPTTEDVLNAMQIVYHSRTSIGMCQDCIFVRNDTDSIAPVARLSPDSGTTLAD
jgi:hypothetical protein